MRPTPMLLMILLMMLLMILLLPASLMAQPPQTGCGRERRYFAHERNCDMYYQCEEGVLREGICPDGLVFDESRSPEQLRCELPFDVDCSRRTALQPALMPSDHCPRLYGLYAHRGDCSRFWKCHEGRAFGFRCPEGLAYDEYAGRCDWPDSVDNCDPEGLLRFKCPQSGGRGELHEPDHLRYPDPSDCRRHFVCVLAADGRRTPRLQACDAGLVFNPDTSACDQPDNVRGCQGYYNNLDSKRLQEMFGR